MFVEKMKFQMLLSIFSCEFWHNFVFVLLVGVHDFQFNIEYRFSYFF